MATPRKIIEVIRAGGVGVLPTDTLYGIVGSALNAQVVERIYKLRKRNLKKPMIVLVGEMRHITSTKSGFGIKLSTVHRKLLTRLWPGKVSVILPCRSKKMSYLHRGMKSIAFRYPKAKWLQKLLCEAGPLVAPSANWEGEPPALTIAQAKKYFKNNADFYFDKGKLESKPSTLVKIVRGKVVVLREGAVKI